jgi:hypothetical protein
MYSRARGQGNDRENEMGMKYALGLNILRRGWSIIICGVSIGRSV